MVKGVRPGGCPTGQAGGFSDTIDAGLSLAIVQERRVIFCNGRGPAFVPANSPAPEAQRYLAPRFSVG